MKTKHILLPTDFSDNAQEAINYAVLFLENATCHFYILNTFQVSPSRLESTRSKARGTRLFQSMMEESQRNVERLVAKITENNKNPKHSFEGHSMAEYLVSAVSWMCFKKNIDYIFMGTKGSSALQEVFMGSNTIRVLKFIDFCPVIAVPEAFIARDPARFAFATNFEHVYTDLELAPLVFLARLWNAKIDVVHVGLGKDLREDQVFSKEFLSRKLHEIPHDFKEVDGHSDISSAIMEYAANEEDTALIAMISYRHSFFEKLTRENVINRVAFYTEIPFLVMPLIEE